MAITTIKAGCGATLYQKVIRDAYGVLFYPDSVSGNKVHIYSSITGSTWTDTNTNMDSYYYPSMCVDSNSELHAVWHSASPSRDIKYSKTIDGVWQTPINLTTNEPGVNLGATIAVDSLNNLHVVFSREIGTPTYSYPSVVSYMKYTASTQSWGAYVDITSVATGAAGWTSPKFCIDSNNNIHVVWVGTAVTDGWYYENTYYRGCINGTWGTTVNLSGNTSRDYVVAFADIAADTSNNLHVVWWNIDASPSLRYRKYTTSWQTAEVVSGSDTGYNKSSCSVSVDAAGTVHVAWTGKSATSPTYDQLIYNKRTTSWQTAQELTSASKYCASACLTGSLFPIVNSNRSCLPSVGAIISWRETNGSTYDEKMYTTTDLVLSDSLPHYTVSASAGTGGTITNNGDNFVHSGDNISFSISANDNYNIADVLVDSVSQGAINAYQFTNVTADHTISVSFTQINPVITATKSGTGTGTLSPLGAVLVTRGNDQQFTFSADSGNVITSLLVDGQSASTTSPYTFTNVQTNHTIELVLTRNTTTITATTSGGGSGTITPSGAVSVNIGAGQPFTIKATATNAFNVSVDSSSVGPAGYYTFSNVQVPHTIDANFIASGTNYAAITDASVNLTSRTDSTRAIARTSNGDLHIVYSKNANDIYYAKSTDGGATWGTLTCLSTAAVVTGKAQIGPSIAVDANDNLHVAWRGYSTTANNIYNIVYNKYTAGVGWGGATLITTGAAYHMYNPTVLVDANNYVYLVYLGKALTGRNLYCNYFTTSWQTRETAETNIGDDTYPVAAVMDTNGYIHCIWTQTPNLYYKVRTTSWQAKATITNAVLNTSKYGIDLDSNNIPHVVYCTANAVVKYRNRIGGSWQAEEQVNSSLDTDIQKYPQITVDSMNRVHVTWYGYLDQRLRYRRKTASGWGHITEMYYGYSDVTNPGIYQLGATYPIINSQKTNKPRSGAVVLFHGHTNDNYQLKVFKTSDLVFGLPGYILTPSSGANGSISPAVPTDVDSGGSQTFNFTPNEGYLVSDVLVDGVSIGTTPTSYEFTNVTANHTISVTFGEDPYITATAGEHGTIDPSGVIGNLHGANETFNFYPDTGYAVNDVLVDDVSIGHPSDYTFTNIQVDHTISVSFIIQSFVIATTLGDGGYVSDSNPAVNYGSNKTISIYTYPGYSIEDVKIDSVSVGTVDHYDFTNVTTGHTMEVTFSGGLVSSIPVTYFNMVCSSL